MSFLVKTMKRNHRTHHSKIISHLCTCFQISNELATENDYVDLHEWWEFFRRFSSFSMLFRHFSWSLSFHIFQFLFQLLFIPIFHAFIAYFFALLSFLPYFQDWFFLFKLTREKSWIRYAVFSTLSVCNFSQSDHSSWFMHPSV